MRWIVSSTTSSALLASWTRSAGSSSAWKLQLSTTTLRRRFSSSQLKGISFSTTCSLFSDWKTMDRPGDEKSMPHRDGMEEASSKDRRRDELPLAWSVCLACRGQGRFERLPTRKAFKRAKHQPHGSTPPNPRIQVCEKCHGSGLIHCRSPEDDPSGLPTFVHAERLLSSTNHEPTRSLKIAIVGGGLAGLALATALRHRNIKCTVYERDEHFLDRSQGYGLTLQQASKALRGFGIETLKDGIVSTKHVVHTTDGSVVGEWGFRQWGRSLAKSEPKRQNVHIARQALRYQLLQAAGGEESVRWNHKLVQFEESEDGVQLTFQEGERRVEEHADLLVGADGIRSIVREQWIGGETPLRYLDCMVLLGICPLEPGHNAQSQLLDGETVFQTADGETRMYMMPYSKTEYMWQLSFPMDEATATSLSQQGSASLKSEALARCQSWHSPIPDILHRTPETLVSGYPVFDRSMLTPEMLLSLKRVTLIGDAGHPMSPFKGQGANQALLDALQLARTLYSVNDGSCPLDTALQSFEREMLQRTAVKVEASAQAARFLHSDVAMQEGNVTRGAAAAASGRDSNA